MSQEKASVEWKDADTACRKCGSRNVKYRVWESSDGAHEDLNFKCEDCKASWWIDGPDY